MLKSFVPYELLSQRLLYSTLQLSCRERARAREFSSSASFFHLSFFLVLMEKPVVYLHSQQYLIRNHFVPYLLRVNVVTQRRSADETDIL